MTMLGRGRRSTKKTEDKTDRRDKADKSEKQEKPEKAEKPVEASKTDKTDKNGKADKAADRAARAEEAAEAARLAEEAAARAREAARLAQEAAEAAAEAEAEDEEPAEEPAKSLQEPEAPEKASEDDSAPEDASEEVSAPDAAVEDSEEGGEDAEEDAEEDAKPARTRRLTIKKSARNDDDEDAEDDEDEDEGDAEPRARMGGLATVIGVLAVLAIALGAGTTVLALKVRERAATEQATREASFASSRAAQKLSSYDYRTLDADLKSAEAATTGKLRTDYGKLAQQLKTVAIQQEAISNTTIVKIGVISSSPDKVVTLIYANRSSATKNDRQPRLPEPLRIKMTMVKKGEGKWLASEAKVL